MPLPDLDPEKEPTMLLDRYETRFFNANFKEDATSAACQAYRGEFILVEGEIADAHGRRKPPVSLLRQAVLLSCGDSLSLISGSLDELETAPALFAAVGAELKPDTVAVIFTVNIPEAFVTRVADSRAVFIPLVQGMVWNELIDLVALDKSDFKGKSAADKVVTLYEALKDYGFKYPEKTLEEALTSTNEAKRETHGAI